MANKKQKIKRKEKLEESFNLRHLTEDEIKDIANKIVTNEIFTDRHLRSYNETTFMTVFMPLFLIEKKDREFIVKNQPAMVYAYMKDTMGSRSINGNPCFSSISFVWNQEDVEKIFNKGQEILEFMEIKERSFETSGDGKKAN